MGRNMTHRLGKGGFCSLQESRGYNVSQAEKSQQRHPNLMRGPAGEGKGLELGDGGFGLQRKIDNMC